MATITETMTDKLHPRRIRGASDMMYYIIARILSAGWVTNELDGGDTFHISSDGHVTTGSIYIGSAADFERNVRGYVDAAELTEEERRAFWQRYHDIVRDWR